MNTGLLAAIVLAAGMMGIGAAYLQKGRQRPCFLEEIRPALGQGQEPAPWSKTRAGRELSDLERKSVQAAIDRIGEWESLVPPPLRRTKAVTKQLAEVAICIETIQKYDGSVAATTFPGPYEAARSGVGHDGKATQLEVKGTGQTAIHIMPICALFDEKEGAATEFDKRRHGIDLSLTLLHEAYHVDTAEDVNSYSRDEWECRAYQWCVKYLSELLEKKYSRVRANLAGAASTREKLTEAQRRSESEEMDAIQHYVGVANLEIQRLRRLTEK